MCLRSQRQGSARLTVEIGLRVVDGDTGSVRHGNQILPSTRHEAAPRVAAFHRLARRIAEQQHRSGDEKRLPHLPSVPANIRYFIATAFYSTQSAARPSLRLDAPPRLILPLFRLRLRAMGRDDAFAAKLLLATASVEYWR
jgi:hypothetical protein